jgi:hypothetical protein
MDGFAGSGVFALRSGPASWLSQRLAISLCRSVASTQPIHRWEVVTSPIKLHRCQFDDNDRRPIVKLALRLSDAFRGRPRSARPAGDTHIHPRGLGLARAIVDGVEYALVDRDAGDAAPYLPREVYEALRFYPRYDELPLSDDE